MTINELINFAKENKLSFDTEIVLNIGDAYGSSDIDYSSDLEITKFPEASNDIVILIK